jgi:uncharacterized protein
MTLNKYKKIADELSVTEKQVKVTIELLDEGGTVPFIARYRKEATGALMRFRLRLFVIESSNLRSLISAGKRF